MVDTKQKEGKTIKEGMHQKLLAGVKRAGKTRDKYVLENRLFHILCNDSQMEPRVCAEELNWRYHYSMDGDGVIRVLRECRMSNRGEREELFRWAEQVATYFAEAAKGNRESYEQFEQLRKTAALKNGKRQEFQERIAVHMIYAKCPELVSEEDLEQMCLFGNTLAKYFFYDVADVLAEVCGYPQYYEKKNKSSEKKLTYEQLARKAAMLESTLERTNIMLQDLQEEFEEQLEESKVREMTEFFAKLNSDRYGYILDELLQINKGAEVLRKNGYTLPLEINGMIIMLKQLIQFVKDNHIEPIMKINSIRQVLATDIEFCNYEGTPFASGNEVKTVRVVSPGWVYKDKEIQISRPKVKEEQENE